MMSRIQGRIEKIEWDSAFFSKNIGRLSFEKNNENFEQTKFNYDLIFAKIDSKDYHNVNLLTKHSFCLAETEIVISFVVNNVQKAKYLIAGESEKEEIVDIAKRSFLNHTRYRYPWFKNEETERYYSKWAENAILGVFDDECLVLPEGKLIQGFITIKILNKNTGRIGLVVTHPRMRNRGIAYQLLMAALSRFNYYGINNVYVSTQLSNISAIRLYEKAGGTVSASSYWFYMSNMIS